MSVLGIELPELNIPVLVGSLMEVVVLASMVPVWALLGDQSLAGIGLGKADWARTCIVRRWHLIASLGVRIANMSWRSEI